MNKSLRTGAFILYNFAVIIAVFAAAEFAARRFGHRTPQPETLRDRYAAYRNTPDLRSVYFRHNAQGFRRDTDIPLAKPPNTSRVFLMGGSVTYGGEGLYPEVDASPPPSSNQTIDYYLEQQLNTAYPSKRWEVINAGVKGYLVHQDLARLLSEVLRYKPDYVISIDGVNDLSSLLRAPPDYDPYLMPEQITEFDHLANPKSLASVRIFLATWLRNNSVLFRAAQDWMSDRVHRQRRRAKTYNPLSAADRTQYQLSASQLDTYLHTVRQMHAILALEGVTDIFALQPELAVSRKPRTDLEQRLDDLHRRAEGSLFVYGFQTLYPRLSTLLAADAAQRGYRFVDLTGVFDSTSSKVFTDYCHLTPEGNRLIAARLAPLLR